MIQWRRLRQQLIKSPSADIAISLGNSRFQSGSTVSAGRFIARFCTGTSHSTTDLHLLANRRPRKSVLKAS